MITKNASCPVDKVFCMITLYIIFKIPAKHRWRSTYTCFENLLIIIFVERKTLYAYEKGAIFLNKRIPVCWRCTWLHSLFPASYNVKNVSSRTSFKTILFCNYMTPCFLNRTFWFFQTGRSSFLKLDSPFCIWGKVRSVLKKAMGLTSIEKLCCTVDQESFTLM